jgi:hypothetical protein
VLAAGPLGGSSFRAHPDPLLRSTAKELELVTDELMFTAGRGRVAGAEPLLPGAVLARPMYLTMRSLLSA